MALYKVVKEIILLLLRPIKRLSFILKASKRFKLRLYFNNYLVIDSLSNGNQYKLKSKGRQIKFKLLNLDYKTSYSI
jgi:hypothetical protein